MKPEYAMVQRPRTKNTDIVRRMVAPMGEWYFVAKVTSVETARELVRLLNLGAQITEQEYKKSGKAKP